MADPITNNQNGPVGIVDPTYIKEQSDAINAKLGSAANKEGFDPNMFLKILMTQLQNQSPFDTMDTTQILETQTMLSQVEQTAKQTTAVTNMEATLNDELAFINTSLANINATMLDIAEKI